jgi:hypothetical protein
MKTLVHKHSVKIEYALAGLNFAVMPEILSVYGLIGIFLVIHATLEWKEGKPLI